MDATASTNLEAGVITQDDVGAAILLWIAGRLGLPASVRVFVYVIAGFVSLFAGAHLIDTIWTAVRRRRDSSDRG